MAACSAYNCKNKPEKKIKGVTFHSFPKDKLRRQQWILAVRRANWMPSNRSQLCSNHFDEDAFDRTSKIRTLLKKNAVPTIFDGYPPLKNQEHLKPKTDVIPRYNLQLKPDPFQGIEPLEDISNDKNRILVVPEGLEVEATINNGYNDDKKNVVVIKNKTDCKTILNCDDDADDNRAIIVSDGTNVETEWCGIVGEDDNSNEEPSYDPNYGLESCRSDYVNISKLKALLSFDPDFYVRRIKTLKEKIKNLQKTKKLMLQTARRRRRKIIKFQKEVHRIKKNIRSPKCSTRPIVHVFSQAVSN